MALPTAKQADTTPDKAKDPYRVMLVDDSAVIRGLVTRMLSSDPMIQIVASVGNGQHALSTMDGKGIEVAVVDIEMPVMDGLTAVPKLLEKDPKLQIIMSSTLTVKNAEVSLKALSLGAADYIGKPTSVSQMSETSDFKQDLLDKVKALGAAYRRATGGRKQQPATTTPAKEVREKPASASAQPSSAAAKTPAVFTLRPAPKNFTADVIAIGSSTGGPQALFRVFENLKGKNISLPIFVTQHMPTTFTKILAEHITRAFGKDAFEGVDGETVQENRVYVAPGGFHMVVEAKGKDKVIRLLSTPPENFCRPAVDPMFRSIAAAYGNKVLAAVLTGMGSDGAKGAKVIVDAGGYVLAQDEATSVVWGMPGATAMSGVCSAVLPIDDIASHIEKIVVRR